LKRTSTTEEKYKLFILEFAALKFALDQFSDVIWGAPVEIEIDCQALRDTLLSPKLSIAHMHWRDGILTYHITDVRHRPGNTNTAMDSLSRSLETREHTNTNGSEWMVNEDWEAARGIVQDLLSIETSSSTSDCEIPTDVTMLQQKFAKEPLFLDIVEALYDLDSNKSIKTKQRA
jgi:hypothetical protein